MRLRCASPPWESIEHMAMQPEARRRVLMIAILALAVGASWALSETRPQPAMRPAVSRAPLVDVLEPVPMTTRFQVHSQGTVMPVTETVLSAEVSGSITEISPKFVAGGLFAPDEVLLRIDPTDYEVALEQAEALVRQRQIEYDAARNLRNQGYGAEADLASAAAALASAAAERVRARRNLERTRIRVPYEGLVRSRSVGLGQYVAPGTPLGIVFSTARAEVRLPLTDEDLAFVDLPGPAAPAGAPAAAGPVVTLTATQKGRTRSWQAVIVREEGVIDERSRVTYAVARIEDPYGLQGRGAPLPVGSFVVASIAGIEMDDLIRVPRSAVRASSHIMLVDDDDRLVVASVEVVRADAEYAYLRAPEVAARRIVLTALESPVDGMPVRTADHHGNDLIADQGAHGP